MKRPQEPLRFNTFYRNEEEQIKDWIKGKKDCDLITDIFHAAGFEAEFVIVFGNRNSLSAASRATTKLAIVETDKFIKKKTTLSNSVKKSNISNTLFVKEPTSVLKAMPSMEEMLKTMQIVLASRR